MARSRAPVYGLDIETDTSVNGLDPAVGGIVTVALSSPSADEVFDGPEIDMLAAVDARLAALPPGVLATWNGAFFDLPFLADRAAHHGLALGLRLAGPPHPVAATRFPAISAPTGPAGTATATSARTSSTAATWGPPWASRVR